MSKVTEISPRRLARLNEGFTTSTDDVWTVYTAKATGKEIFRASDKQWADYVIEAITGQPAAA